MTALADSLAVAQARAVAALSKAFMNGKGDIDTEGEAMIAALNSMGLTDKVEQDHLMQSLTVLRTLGVTDSNGATPAQPEPASQKQLDYIAKLADEKSYAAPEGPFTKAQASEIIDTLQKGTYDQAKWEVPF